MKVTYTELHPEAKVWIYQSNVELTDKQAEEGNDLINRFLDSWTSHNVALPSCGFIKHNRFIVMMADQSTVTAGGCSMDKMVHFVEALENHWNVSLLDRTMIAYKNPESDTIKTINFSDLKSGFMRGIITENTLVFDNLVDTKEKFETNWEKNILNSWHKRFL
jgi:hypothetical protein